jgi:hypothetical protein
MRPVRCRLEPLLDLFRRWRALRMPEMKLALRTQVDATVFRKLSGLPYRTSYSHRGAFYTLDSLARFDAQGLWSCRGAWFSRYGTLLESTLALVNEAPAGYLAAELQAVLHVPVKDPLRQLVRAERLHRELFEGLYLYSSAERSRRQEQWAARQAQAGGEDAVEDQLQAARVLFYSLLNEQQRRLYAGLESAHLGHGGDRLMALALGLAEATVARGRRQLLGGQVQRERVRRVGGGRPRAEKKRPAS